MTTRINEMIPVTETGDLLAAVPHLLGFHPGDSLVLLTVDEGSGTPRIGSTLRIDLPCPGQRSGLTDFLLDGPLGRQRPEALIIVVIGRSMSSELCAEHCDDADCCAADAEGESPPHEGLVGVLTRALERAGISIVHALWTEEISQGARWSCYSDPECSGRIADPGSSSVGAAMAAAGSVTFASRAELRELVAPESDTDLARRSARLDALLEQLEDDHDSGRPAADLRAVFAGIERIADGAALTEEDLLRVLLAIADARVRDIVLATAVGERAVAAEQLWLTLVRMAPVPEVADAGALLAFSAYVRGDGALAGAALERVEEARPEHALACLLRHALQAGIPPNELARVALDAAEDARALLHEGGPE
ncbi:DUF4192 domain-containing protein [Saccharopolyspora sp. HNM0983]|uniref:DUF4192 domain-containing protein n=1 Tax=Saccharopolyspora montiporae TaxID=2781240 RepID=A0A929B4M9_9PSEU|nr:DUF4192 domain-containing protein [Saccharopolyspora sp. HNM0983]MBE9373084.1 DUF4192 domain-containing protein [Saccharopolyspora sp. HNM0983]